MGKGDKYSRVKGKWLGLSFMLSKQNSPSYGCGKSSYIKSRNAAGWKGPSKVIQSNSPQ